MKVVILALLLSAVMLGSNGAPSAVLQPKGGDETVIALFSGLEYQGDSIVVKIPRGQVFDLDTIGWDGRYWSVIVEYGKCYTFVYGLEDIWGFQVQYDSMYVRNLAQFFFVPPRYIKVTEGSCPQ